MSGRSVLRQCLGFCAAVLITSGALLLADVALTLAWQEPLTSFLANRDQARLERELGGQRTLVGADRRALAGVRDSRRLLAGLARRARRRARPRHAIGRIALPALGRSYAVVEGDDTDSLKKGPGHYPATPFPGEGGTVAIAGHRTTYLAPFRTIDDLRRGNRVVLEMPYARLTYTVTKKRVVAPTAVSILDRVGREQLVLTTCHPLHSASRRYVVFARLSEVSMAATVRRLPPAARSGPG